eukprot:c11700_g1_i2.p1 GENE.c11700_g1_i2~~c11700_g1_i2.p1  ORF type:complete len:308 (+),score=65.10 c11700_g1_i2:453-1376(+)
MFLKAGANVNAVDNSQWTPLHVATRKGHVAIIRVLMEAGANINAINEDLCTPRECAEPTANHEVVELLDQANAGEVPNATIEPTSEEPQGGKGQQARHAKPPRKQKPKPRKPKQPQPQPQEQPQEQEQAQEQPQPQPQEQPAAQPSHGFQFDAFLTHNWGPDQEDRDNHARVVQIASLLRTQHNLNVWIDEVQMTGDIVQQMIDGIDNSACVVVFITRKYCDKVNSRDARDNCRKEFNYACRVGHITAEGMIPVVMESGMTNTTDWGGRILMEIGDFLYVPMTTDEEIATNLASLVREIRARHANHQ